MIQKKALIELVRGRINGEFQAKQIGKFGDQKLAYYIGQVYNSALVAVFTRNLTDFTSYIKEYQSVAISQDAISEVYYSTLPAPIVMIPRKAGSGVMRISGLTSKTIEFVPMTNGDLQTIEGLEVDDVDDVIGYVFKNGRIEYHGMTTTVAAGTVKMELVIPFESYSDTDYVQIPTGSNEMIIQGVVNLLMGTPDVDKLNNGNSVNRNNIR